MNYGIYKMPRIQKPIRPIQIDYICDKCNVGHYRPAGAMWLSDPPQFPHKCTNAECGDEKTFIERYPTLRYAEEGALIDLENYKEQPS